MFFISPSAAVFLLRFLSGVQTCSVRPHIHHSPAIPSWSVLLGAETQHHALFLLIDSSAVYEFIVGKNGYKQIRSALSSQ